MNLFHIVSKLDKRPIAEAKLELKRRMELSPAQFQADSQKMAWAIFEHHRQHNPLYRQFLADRKIEQWTDIPILQKSTIQQPLENKLSEGYTKKDVYVNNTSGSTGKPFFFAKDRFAHAMTWALILDRFSRHGIDYGRSLQARFYGIPLGFKGYYKEKIKDYISGRIRFPVFDLSDNVLEIYLQRFEQNPFYYLNGYTNSLTVFAKFLIQKGIVLKDRCPTLGVCVTTSELCTPEDRKIMEKGFGVPVVNEYGAAELDLIAFEDEEYDWIISSENLLIEILDENNQPVADGTEGKIIVTSLYNKAMPFIRYELGDMGTVDPVRKGIHPVLQAMQGRLNDMAILPSGRRSPGFTFYYVSKALMESSGIMKEYVIRQIALDTFRYEYVAERQLTPQEEKQVQAMLDKYLEPGLKAVFERKEKIERTKAGKLLHFQSLVKDVAGH